MKHFSIVFVFLILIGFSGNALATHDPSYIHPTPFGISESNYRFIDFSYTNNIGEPIKFVLEKPRDRDCNSYDARITDDEKNFILGWGVEISCAPTDSSNSVPIQTRIGYNENHPIIINDSGKYYLELEFEDLFIRQEFVVRQNHGGANLDEIKYPVPWEIVSPLKQFKSGIAVGEIKCKENFVLIQKYDGSPACVKPRTIEKLIDRNWTNSLIVREIALKTMSKNLGPECSQHTIQEIQDGTVDDQCRQYLTKLSEEHKSEMESRGYSFDHEQNVWVKEGYPDSMMSIVDYYLQNQENKESLLHYTEFDGKITMDNMCTKNQICFGHLDNGTKIQLSCDGMVMHGCSPKTFGDYRETSVVVSIPLGAAVEGNESLDPREVIVVLDQNSTVTWVNEDSVPHRIASDKGGNEFWGTDIILPGNEASIQFNNTGVFEYHGEPHPWVTGKVMVINEDGSVPDSLEITEFDPIQEAGKTISFTVRKTGFGGNYTINSQIFDLENGKIIDTYTLKRTTHNPFEQYDYSITFPIRTSRIAVDEPGNYVLRVESEGLLAEKEFKAIGIQ